MAMTQANHYTHISDGILPHTEARQYDVAAFRDVNYRLYRAELRELRLQLLQMQEWVMETGQRVAVVLEGTRRGWQGLHGIRHYALPQPQVRECDRAGDSYADADAELAGDLLQADAGEGEYHDFRQVVVLKGDHSAGAGVLLDAAVQLLHDACE